jgi:PAS domain S-box-containing protein
MYAFEERARMSQAAKSDLWQDDLVDNVGRPAASWRIEKQQDPVEGYLPFFPDQASGRVYEQLLYNLPINLQCLDGAGCITSVNRQWLETLGYDLKEVTGKHWHEFMTKASRSRLTQEVYPRYLQTGLVRNAEITMLKRDGSQAHMLMSAQGYRGGKGRIERSIVILQEVTAKRSAETALQKAEQRFRGAFDAAAHGIALVAPNGRVLGWNAAFKELSGRSEEDLNQLSFDETVHAEDKAQFLSAMRKLIEGAIPSLKMELRYIGGEQPVVWGFTSVSLVRGETGEIDHLVVQIVDTTSRRQAERQLQQAQKMEAVGQLTGGLAHDFNNILTVIMGNLNLVESVVESDAKARERLAEALDAVTKGSDLAKQLLSFSREQVMEPKEVRVHELIGRMHGMLTRTLGETIELQMLPTTDNAIITVDPTQLETSLINLAINARDAMPDGGKLVIETQFVDLDQDYLMLNPDAKTGRYVMIAVSDTGTGIPKALVDKVFQPFFTTKPQGQGTGLGLSMVYGFATQSGGHVRIYSEEGHGTSVKLYLPLTRIDTAVRAPVPVSAGEAVRQGEAEPQKPQKPTGWKPIVPMATPSPKPPVMAESTPAPAPVAERKAKILVVEDQADVRAVATGFLSDFGYEVVEAPDGIVALRLLAEQSDIDLMFSDVVMPGGLNGFDLAQAAQQIRPDLLIVHTSGYPKGAMVHLEEPRLKDNIIMKPYRREELQRLMAETLAKREAPGPG